jgi:hypothetical protein
MQPDRIEDYLQRLTPVTRNNLLTELERLEVCGTELPDSGGILEKLRAEFRKSEHTHKSGHTNVRIVHPSRYFFMPLEPLLVNGAPEHANSGRTSRGSLAPIWEWITRDLLPTMARDYINQMKGLIAADKEREAKQVGGTFQTKIVKYLESTLGSPDGVNQTRIKLATYTCFAGGLCRPDQDAVRAARTRRPGEMRGCTAGLNRRILQRSALQNYRVAGCAQKNQRR